MGGGVKGGQILGKHPPETRNDGGHGLEPWARADTADYELGGDVAQGVLQWFGVVEESMPVVLPNLANSPTKERIAQAQLFTSG
jgi:hypothetical protein